MSSPPPMHGAASTEGKASDCAGPGSGGDYRGGAGYGGNRAGFGVSGETMDVRRVAIAGAIRRYSRLCQENRGRNFTAVRSGLAKAAPFAPLAGSAESGSPEADAAGRRTLPAGSLLADSAKPGVPVACAGGPAAPLTGSAGLRRG